MILNLVKIFFIIYIKLLLESCVRKCNYKEKIIKILLEETEKNRYNIVSFDEYEKSFIVINLLIFITSLRKQKKF